MSVICFVGGTAITADRMIDDAVVVCRDGVLQYVGRARSRIPARATTVDLRGGYLVPGFIDIHIHGGGGADVMDGTADDVRTVCQSHAAHGTTTLFPTTTTGRPDQIAAMIDACRTVRDDWQITDGAQIGGVHLYGPYFAPSKAGCHNRDECRVPTKREYAKYFRSGMVGVATCAAELDRAGEFYRYATDQGCLVTCGHSNASWTEMQSAFDAGMRHVDHFWCAMSNVSSVRQRLGVPMQGSMLEFVLANPDMSTEVIADGMHLAPELLQFAWQMKTADRLCLVTDCNRALDMPAGRYRFGPKSDGAWFDSDGRVGWAPGGQSLASSVKGMDHMVRTMAKNTTVPLHEIIRMATLTPAKRLGIDGEVGSLEPGKRADLVVLSQRLTVRKVFLGGQRFVPTR